MCAIAGSIDFPIANETVQKMLATMLRRGPDGQGIFQENQCTLLHARLAIVDPAGGGQPMQLAYGAERYTLVYNGELYNTGELRRELMQLGHVFRGHSDTEVVLHSFAQWGMDCVRMFNGIFAFAVWESRRQRLSWPETEWVSSHCSTSTVRTDWCLPPK